VEPILVICDPEVTLPCNNLLEPGVQTGYNPTVSVRSI